MTMVYPSTHTCYNSCCIIIGDESQRNLKPSWNLHAWVVLVCGPCNAMTVDHLGYVRF